MTRHDVLRIQRDLNSMGFGLVEDGIYGPATAAAMRQYQRMNNPAEVGLLIPDPAKPWWTSRAVLGALATIVASLAGALWSLDIDAAQLTDTLLALVTAATGLIALWGSVRRQAPIDPTLVAPGVRLPARERVRREPVPPGPDPARRDGFPRGHFFGDE